jgi:hypothetical protein
VDTAGLRHPSRPRCWTKRGNRRWPSHRTTPSAKITVLCTAQIAACSLQCSLQGLKQWRSSACRHTMRPRWAPPLAIWLLEHGGTKPSHGDISCFWEWVCYRYSDAVHGRYFNRFGSERLGTVLWPASALRQWCTAPPMSTPPQRHTHP